MFEGRTDIAYLNKHNVKWWNDYTNTGDLGKVYGHQIRNYNDNIDQIEYATKEIKNNSRRAVMEFVECKRPARTSAALLLYSITMLVRAK